MNDMGIHSSMDDIQLLFNRFDKNKYGKINFIEVSYQYNYNDLTFKYSLREKLLPNLN